MARQHICVFCNTPIEDVADEIPYKKRFAHRNCYNSFLKATTTVAREKQTDKKQKTPKRTTATTAIKKPVSEEEYQEKREYVSLVKELIGADEIPVQIFAITNNYMERYGLTYHDMTIALEYWYKVKGNVYQEGNLVGIVPYIIDDAKKFFKNLNATMNKNAELDTSNFYAKHTVKIEKPQGREIPLIDIANI